MAKKKIVAATRRVEDNNPSQDDLDTLKEKAAELLSQDRSRLLMKMPFVEKADVELFRLDASVIMVHVGSQKRNIQLPDTLIHAEVKGAEFKDGKLIIKFKRRDYGIQRRGDTEVR